MSELTDAGDLSGKRAIRASRWTGLFLRACAGEPHLFAALVEEMSDLLRRQLRRDTRTKALCDNHHDVEDVLQHTYLRLWQCRQRFDPSRGEVGAWAWSMARNYAIDLLRKRRPTAPASLLEAVEDRRATTPDRSLLLQEQRQALDAALDRVESPKVREALRLRLVDGLPYAEVSRATGVPVGTVANRVHRLRRYLGADALRAA
jgi:RNA polymerase sigma-70 factor (ECF subfamily)